MAQIRTKNDLANYILQELGSPVINVEIEENQLYNQIDKAVEMFVEQAYAGSLETILALDLVAGTQSYELPDTILAVKRVMVSTGQNNDALFSAEYHIMNDYLLFQPNTNNVLSGWEATKGYMELLDEYFGEHHDFDYNPITHTIVFHDTIKSSVPARLVAYTAIAADFIPNTGANDIFNVRWIKAMSTALARRQWGFNISKFEGIPLPGGGTLNGGVLIDRAEAQIEKLEQELEDRYEAPIDFYVG